MLFKTQFGKESEISAGAEKYRGKTCVRLRLRQPWQQSDAFMTVEQARGLRDELDSAIAAADAVRSTQPKETL